MKRGNSDNDDDDGEGESEAASVENTLPDLKTAVVHQWSFKNNGIVFRDEDWSRLKKIGLSLSPCLYACLSDRQM